MFARRLLTASFILTLVCAFLPAKPLTAQTPLQSLNGPKGGIILYGKVDGANSPPSAMGVILRHLHQQYGDRPQVGRVFRVRGTQSDAVFFTLTRQSPTTLRVAGMLITANTPSGVEAALLSDDASRFGTSINPMLETLFTAWKPGGRSLASSAQPANRVSAPTAEASAPAAPMHPFRLPDGSATMMLAEGWHVLPGSGGGTIFAQGSHGETVVLGLAYLAHDTNNPHTAQMRAFGASAAGRNTAYAKSLYAPWGADLGRTFVELNAQSARMSGPSVVPVQIEQEQPIRSMGAVRCAILTGNTQAAGGHPAMQVEGSFCEMQEDSFGLFMNMANLAFAPNEIAARERSTLRAMLSSFQVNGAVVNAQATAIAKPTVDAIHQIGADVTARIAAADHQNDERRAAFEQHNDVMDRTSQGFSNYILDKSVIVDNQTGEHGTAWNSTAQLLVKSDPKRFEYVDTPNYWKGVDY